MESDVPFRLGFVLSELWKPKNVGKKPHKTRRESMLTAQRLKSDVLLLLRICIKRVVEAKQNQELWEGSHTKPGDNPC